MGSVTLKDVNITSLGKISTEGGDVFHAMKNTDAGFAGYGEAYFSWINYGAVKAWKRHLTMTMNLIVPLGNVRFVFYADNNDESDHYRVIEIGMDNYSRITVPQGIWFGFQGLAAPKSLILNISNISHDSDEVERRALDRIPYIW